MFSLCVNYGCLWLHKDTLTIQILARLTPSESRPLPFLDGRPLYSGCPLAAGPLDESRQCRHRLGVPPVILPALLVHPLYGLRMTVCTFFELKVNLPVS